MDLDDSDSTKQALTTPKLASTILTSYLKTHNKDPMQLNEAKVKKNESNNSSLKRNKKKRKIVVSPLKGVQMLLKRFQRSDNIKNIKNKLKNNKLTTI